MMQLKWVWANMGGRKARYIIAGIAGLISSAAVFFTPRIAQALVDLVVMGVEQPDGSVFRRMDLLFPLAGAMVFATVFRMCLYFYQMMVMETTAKNTDKELRDKMFHRLMLFNPDFYDTFRTGDIMTRLTGDLDFLRHCFAFTLRHIANSTVLFISATVFFFSVNAKLTLLLLAITPLVLIISFLYFKKVRPLYTAQRERLAALNTCTQENISGNRVIKAFAKEEYEKEKFREKNEGYRDGNIEINRYWLKFYPFLDVLANSLTVITLLAGGIFVINGEMTLGQLVAVNSITWALSEPMRQLGVHLNDLQRFFSSAAKVIELFDTEPKLLSGTVTQGTAPGTVEFAGVSFGFGGVGVLKDVSFKVKRGETLAIMGVTGSGKTTIVNLLTRMYDVDKGRILVDGIDIRKWDCGALRHRIGVATQDVFLFSDTAEGNIAYGNQELSEAEVRRYAGLACAEFIEKLPEGYDTIIGERGVGLSGGQKQRIALARALAVRPEILVLDDTTSALDSETEADIQRNINSLDFDCTKIIIAQRISSVKEADRIIVLDDGGIAESGTHGELVALGGKYAEVYRIQRGVESAVMA